MLMERAKLKISGDSAILVEFENRIAPEINRLVRNFTLSLEKEQIPGIVEIVPAYCAVTVHYRPETILFDALKTRLSAVLEKLGEADIPAADVWELPVLYGGEAGPDLGFVAEHNGLTPEDVIRIHSESEYLVYMLGFTPGFPYLGGMSPAIETPRLTAPRLRIPAGSVGIAGKQTGVYPIPSPGGWQLIGRTPVRLYDAEREEPVLIRAGDYVKFVPVSGEEYARIAAEAAAGTYRCRTWKKEG